MLNLVKNGYALILTVKVLLRYVWYKWCDKLNVSVFTCIIFTLNLANKYV